MTSFVVGDYVVAEWKPNCIQEVVRVEDSPYGGQNLYLIPVWRLDGGELSKKPGAPQRSFKFRHVEVTELEEAQERLNEVIAVAIGRRGRR